MNQLALRSTRRHFDVMYMDVGTNLKKMNHLSKIIILGFITLVFSCKTTNEHIKPIIINETLSPELADDFYKKDLEILYPKLLTSQNFNSKRDTILVKKIEDFQNTLINGLKTEKINWNVDESEISIFTRIYFDNTGQIEYFAFEIYNDGVKLKALEEFKRILEKNISDQNLGIVRKTKYNHCMNFKLPVKE